MWPLITLPQDALGAFGMRIAHLARVASLGLTGLASLGQNLGCGREEEGTGPRPSEEMQKIQLKLSLLEIYIGREPHDASRNPENSEISKGAANFLENNSNLFLKKSLRYLGKTDTIGIWIERVIFEGSEIRAVINIPILFSTAEK